MGRLNFDDLWKDNGPATAAKKPRSAQKSYAWRYRRIHRGSMKPYDTWKQEFMLDRCCTEKDFIKELLIASSPHVLLNLLLIAYLLIGTVVLQSIDESIAKEDFPPALLFTFTTIATIGYGSIYPTTDIGKVCCIGYCVIGIPLIFLVLSNNGQFLVDAYWIIRKSSGGKGSVSKGLPLWVSVLLLCLHSLLGGLMFSTWLGQMNFFDAVYCSFISVSTIGYGDLVPVPDSWAHTVAIIAFLSVGVVILSTLFDTFRCYLQYVHYLGRPFRGTKDVEVWFGGSVLTVQDLITLVAEQFGVCPQRLRDVIRDLDSILEAACDNTVRNYSESLYRTSEEMQREARVLLLENGDKRAVVLRREQTVSKKLPPLYRFLSTDTTQKLIVREAENAVQALRVIHRQLSKSSRRPLLRKEATSIKTRRITL